MGEVLKFQPKDTSAGKPDKPMVAAEIFIFPGVRIERRGFSLADRLYTSSKPAHESRQTRQKSKE